MPIIDCTKNGKPGKKCGQSGKCYTGPDAAQNAANQCIAIGHSPSSDKRKSSSRKK